MHRYIRRTLYAALFFTPALVMGATGIRALSTREHPPILPPLPADSLALVPVPAHDSTRPTVAVLLGADITEITDALGPYEMFARAGMFNVYAVAPERRPTLLSGGLRILPHYSLAGLDSLLGGRPPAIVVVPNFPNVDRAENRPLIEWMPRQASAGALMHSWCTGAKALAEAGLLDGRTATAHWGDLAKLEKRYPEVDWVRGVRWVDHDSIITSAGLTSGVDASLRVLARVAGDSTARRVAQEMRYPNYHFASDPVAPPYNIRPADAVLLANSAWRISRPQIGIGLYDGVGEFDLSNLYDTHAYTTVAEVHAVASAPGAVRSAHGMTFLPTVIAAAGPDVERLDRLVLPGRDAAERGAQLVSAMAAAAPELTPTFLHAESGERFDLEPVLEDLARTTDRATATFALRRLEYRSDTIRFEGAAFPWALLPLPLGLGVLCVLVGLGIERKVRQPRRA